MRRRRRPGLRGKRWNWCAIYAGERPAKDVPVAERLELGQARSAPVLAGLREKLLGWKEQLLPKDAMAEAVNYALSQSAELSVLCHDGAVLNRKKLLLRATRGAAGRRPFWRA